MRSQFKGFVFFLFLFSQLSAQDVTISVYAPGYSNKRISLWFEDDLFTGHRKLINSEYLDGDSVQFSIVTKQIVLIRIELDYQYALMLVEPMKNYRITFPLPDDKSALSLAKKSRVQPLFNNPDSSDINVKIAEFNELMDGFILNKLTVEPVLGTDTSLGIEPGIEELMDDRYEVNRFSEKGFLKDLAFFKLRMDSVYGHNGDYFNVYREYAFANLEYSFGKKRRMLFYDYLQDKPVAYHNIEYVKYFNTYYKDFFDFYSYYPYTKKLISAFESAEPARALLELIKEDTLTGSDELQQLILLKGLFDLYPETNSWKKRIIEILVSLKNGNPYPDQRFIAGNMIDKLLKGQPGTIIPEMNYINVEGDTLSLSDLGGEIVYIQFFASWNTSALAEMELMTELKKQYGNMVRFLSISIDEKQEDFKRFVKNNKSFKWDFGWVGDDPVIWLDFEIDHLPLFYLIDKQGKIIGSLSPSTGIESNFHKIKYKNKQKKKSNYWDKAPNKSIKEG